jgi:hypothetical protein
VLQCIVVLKSNFSFPLEDFLATEEEKTWRMNRRTDMDCSGGLIWRLFWKTDMNAVRRTYMRLVRRTDMEAGLEN